MLLYLDESGNTQKLIALCLLAVQPYSVNQINQLFTLRPTDPKEVHYLYNLIENNKPKSEFKYSDFIHAFKSTGNPVYHDFVKKKLAELSKIDLRAFFTVFPNPVENEKRLERIRQETQCLIEKWVLNNFDNTLGDNLRIIGDKQIFLKPHYLYAYRFRNLQFAEVLATDEKPKYYRQSASKKEVQIEQASSKHVKALQATDFLAGAFRQKYSFNNPEFFEIFNRKITRNENIRVNTDETSYKLPPSRTERVARKNI